MLLQFATVQLCIFQATDQQSFIHSTQVIRASTHPGCLAPSVQRHHHHTAPGCSGACKCGVSLGSRAAEIDDACMEHAQEGNAGIAGALVNLIVVVESVCMSACCGGTACYQFGMPALEFQSPLLTFYWSHLSACLQDQGMHAATALTQLRARHVLMAWNAWAVRERQLRLAAGWLAPVVSNASCLCDCCPLKFQGWHTWPVRERQLH